MAVTAESGLGGIFGICDLPDPAFNEYYDSIVVDEEIKEAFFKYGRWILQARGLSTVRCGLNRLILLSGPPGVGKTTLAVGTANKIAEAELARNGRRTRLLTLNAGSVFSEFLGRTSKAITDAFQAIRIAANHHLVVVILDELESLGLERSSLGAGDPSDVLRGVNTLLTELDELRRCEGVIVIATSNLTTRIDRALLDRADIELRLDLPVKQAAREILSHSSEELKKVGVEIAPSFIDRLTNALYDDSFGAVLSGRDLSKLLPVTVALKGANHMEVAVVVRVAGKFVAKDKEEANSGNNQKETGSRDE